MKKNLFILALICFSFVGCKKDNGGTTTGEDLSYVYQKYYRYELNNRIYKTIRTYDGHKQTGYKYYYDGLLYAEDKNYSYNGLNASYDSYSYRDGDANNVTVQHIECEYLDDTYQRIKYQKSYYPNSQNTDIHETYYWYDGKKKLSSKSYTNGLLSDEVIYSYDGMRCSYKTMLYYSPGIIYQERNYEILYLDETYLRQKSRLETRKRFDTEGNLMSSNTYYSVYDYDGKKPIGNQFYHNGKLGSVGRDYQYDGLNCIYFVDEYNIDGEVVYTSSSEVEYLE